MNKRFSDIYVYIDFLGRAYELLDLFKLETKYKVMIWNVIDTKHYEILRLDKEFKFIEKSASLRKYTYEKRYVIDTLKDHMKSFRMV